MEPSSGSMVMAGLVAIGAGSMKKHYFFRKHPSLFARMKARYFQRCQERVSKMLASSNGPDRYELAVIAFVLTVAGVASLRWIIGQ